MSLYSELVMVKSFFPRGTGSKRFGLWDFDPPGHLFTPRGSQAVRHHEHFKIEFCCCCCSADIMSMPSPEQWHIGIGTPEEVATLATRERLVGSHGNADTTRVRQHGLRLSLEESDTFAAPW